MLEKTDMSYAPWTIVGANDKNFATLKIITTATKAIETYIEHMTRTPEQQTIKYMDKAISKSSLNLMPLSWTKSICHKPSPLRNTKNPRDFIKRILKPYSTSFSGKGVP